MNDFEVPASSVVWSYDTDSVGESSAICIALIIIQLIVVITL